MQSSTPVMKRALLTAGRACAKARNQPLRRISRLAYGDSAFFLRVARGKAFTTHKYDEVMAWLANPKNWPDEVIPDGAVPDVFADKS